MTSSRHLRASTVNPEVNQTDPGTKQAAPSAPRLEKPKQTLQYLPQGQHKVVLIISQPASAPGFTSGREKLELGALKCSGAILLDCDATSHNPGAREGCWARLRKGGSERRSGLLLISELTEDGSKASTGTDGFAQNCQPGANEEGQVGGFQEVEGLFTRRCEICRRRRKKRKDGVQGCEQERR